MDSDILAIISVRVPKTDQKGLVDSLGPVIQAASSSGDVVFVDLHLYNLDDEPTPRLVK